MKISLLDFEKKINKECRRVLGIDAESLPNLYWQDYWEEGMTIKEANLAVENFITTALESWTQL